MKPFKLILLEEQKRILLGVLLLADANDNSEINKLLDDLNELNKLIEIEKSKFNK